MPVAWMLLPRLPLWTTPLLPRPQLPPTLPPTLLLRTALPTLLRTMLLPWMTPPQAK